MCTFLDGGFVRLHTWPFISEKDVLKNLNFRACKSNN